MHKQPWALCRRKPIIWSYRKRCTLMRAKTPNATCCQSIWYKRLSERRKFRSRKKKYGKTEKKLNHSISFFIGFASNEQRALHQPSTSALLYLGSIGNQSQRSIDDSVCILCIERHQFNIISNQIQNKRPSDTIGIDTERGLNERKKKKIK